jgi:hypothetical protein
MHRPHRSVDPAKKLARVLEEALTGFGRDHAAAVALKKARLERNFKRLT